MAQISTNHPLNWQPVKHSVFKDEELADRIHENGYAVLPLLTEDQVDQIMEIYQREHSISAEQGGMFYSMYSSDNDYRLRVHEEIQAILQPMLETHFKHYKNIVNSFVVKMSGDQSEFYVHQDTTAMDEFRYSPLSLWIPLHDITSENGALTVIEKTHWMFSPYRGVSFPFPFSGILNTVRRYLKPIYMKKGEVLVFDPRIVHNSMKNTSGKDRIAVICGIFDQDTRFVSCYKDPAVKNSPIELYEHEDDYVLKYANFFYDCHVRPTSGVKTGEVEDQFPQMEEAEFVALCDELGIATSNILDSESGVQCHLVAEPDGINKPELVCATPPVEQPAEKPKGFFSWFKRS